MSTFQTRYDAKSKAPNPFSLLINARDREHIPYAHIYSIDFQVVKKYFKPNWKNKQYSVPSQQTSTKLPDGGTGITTL
jgi:hypothetical protein